MYPGRRCGRLRLQEFIAKLETKEVKAVLIPPRLPPLRRLP